MQAIVFSPPTSQQITNSKAIAMLLVVMGHAPGLHPALMNFIYAFHMPVFFFLSGLLLSEAKLALPLGRFLKLQLHSLGIPYVFFFALSYLYWLPTHQLSSTTLKHGLSAWWEPLLGFLLGGQQAWVVNAVLWFFVCLLMTTCIYYFLKRFFSARLLAMLLGALGLMFALVYNSAWPRWPWMLDSTLIALGFYAAGHAMRNWLSQRSAWSRTRAAMMATLFCLALVLGATFNGKVDLNFLSFGQYPGLYFVNAYLGIVALWFACQLLPNQRALTWIAQHTIIIFPTHLLLFSVFTGFAVVVLGWPHHFKESSWIWTVIFPVLAVGASYPIAMILARCCPKLIGHRGPKLQEFTQSSRIHA